MCFPQESGHKIMDASLMSTLGTTFGVIIFLFVVNCLPILAGVVLGEKFSYPLDRNLLWLDGKPLFGQKNSTRGCGHYCRRNARMRSSGRTVVARRSGRGIAGDLISTLRVGDRYGRLINNQLFQTGGPPPYRCWSIKT